MLLVELQRKRFKLKFTVQKTNDGSFEAKDIGRIKANFVNGPATETDGVDIFVKYEDDYRNGVISAGVEAAYVIDYSVDAYSIGGNQVAALTMCWILQY